MCLRGCARFAVQTQVLRGVAVREESRNECCFAASVKNRRSNPLSCGFVAFGCSSLNVKVNISVFAHFRKAHQKALEIPKNLSRKVLGPSETPCGEQYLPGVSRAPVTAKRRLWRSVRVQGARKKTGPTRISIREGLIRPVLGLTPSGRCARQRPHLLSYRCVAFSPQRRNRALAFFLLWIRISPA